MTTQPPDLKKLRELIGAYWACAYREGQQDRTHDTPSGEAQSLCNAIESELKGIAKLQEAYEASARGATTHSNSCDCDICDRARDRASLEAELEDCLADAERYRWLRKHKWVQWEPIDGCAIQSSLLDQAIDAARHATQGD